MANTASHPQTILPPGSQAPDFTLMATPDQSLTLSELGGQPVVLVFCSADWSEVCGDELAVFNQALPLIRQDDATLLGISVDSVWCHQAFSENRKLQFDLLSDFQPKGKVASEYGAYDTEHGYCVRALFVVDVLDALDKLKKSS